MSYSRDRRYALVVLALAIVLVLFITACSSGPRTGTVIQKQYIAAHYDYHQAPVCQLWVTHSHTGTSTIYRNGRPVGTKVYTYYTTDCGFWGTKTWRTWVNDQWGLRLDDHGNRGYRYVDLVTFDACQVGQHFDGSVCR